MPTSTDGQPDPTVSQDEAQTTSAQQQDAQPVLEDLEAENTEELASVKGGLRPYA